MPHETDLTGAINKLIDEEIILENIDMNRPFTIILIYGQRSSEY